jgi:DNA-3-methyladenine glycosylase II
VAAASALAARDRHLASIYRVHGPPPMWGRRPGFSTLLRIIIEQQVSLNSARAMFARLKSNIEPFTAEQFIELGESYLRSLGADATEIALLRSGGRGFQERSA